MVKIQEESISTSESTHKSIMSLHDALSESKTIESIIDIETSVTDPKLKPLKLHKESFLNSQDKYILIQNITLGTHDSIAEDHVDKVFYTALRVETSLERYKIVFDRLSKWLDENKKEALFAVEIPPSCTVTLQTADPSTLIKLFFVVQILISSWEVYLGKINTYLNIYGELTPAAIANLAIIRHQLNLSYPEAIDLQDKVARFYNDKLASKYDHFRKQLLVCKQESDLTEDFKKIMKEKADIMNLPRIDADFLINERIRALRSEAEQIEIRKKIELEAERQRIESREMSFQKYRQSFEELVADNLGHENSLENADIFSRNLMENILKSEFKRGQLVENRNFYNLNEKEIQKIEKQVLDEIYRIRSLIHH